MDLPLTELKDIVKPRRAGLAMIAGPCSAENPEQLAATAAALAPHIDIFRAGLWKPRTKPGCFEGVGQRGLDWLVDVKRRFGVKVATEVITPEHARLAIEAGVDVLWIGARTSANPFAISELAQAIAQLDPDRAVMVKNPVSADLELWIGAMQRLYNAGLRRLAAIHRGFARYGDSRYRNAPQWAIPIEFMRRLPEVPLICDPSHIGGRRELVDRLSQHALDMGMRGLMIEVHPDPKNALSDGGQQIVPADFVKLADSLIHRSPSVDTPELETLRSRIDECDEELLDILASRMAVCREIGEYKKRHNMAAMQIGRHDEMMASRRRQGAELGLDSEFASRLLSLIHAESVKIQIEILEKRKDGRP